MERQLRDVMTKVLGLWGRLEQQSTQATKDELTAIHGALNNLLTSAQDADDCAEDHD